MKDKLIHVCLVLDESGSMYESTQDVKGGVKRIIDEQKANKDGECIISLFKFNGTVTEVYIGKKLDEIGELDYHPGGITAMYDGVGTAIDKIGKWLADMPEEERPSQNLIAVFTDGLENASTEYSSDKVKSMIKHQTDVYSWKFMYMGADVTTAKDANAMGISSMTYTSKRNLSANYDIVNEAVSTWRTYSSDLNMARATMDSYITGASEILTSQYETEKNIKIT